MKSRWFCEKCGQDDVGMLYFYYKPYGRFLCAHCVTDLVLRLRGYSSDTNTTEVLQALGLVEVEKYFHDKHKQGE